MVPPPPPPKKKCSRSKRKIFHTKAVERGERITVTSDHDVNNNKTVSNTRYNIEPTVYQFSPEVRLPLVKLNHYDEKQDLLSDY